MSPPETRAAGHMAAVQSLRIDLEVAGAVTALRERGVRAVLLKGATIARWLYTDGTPRPYVDVDLWVAPAQFDQAETVLAELGLGAPLDAASPLEQDHHARVWVGPGCEVDLHRTFLGIAAAPERAWEVLTADTVPVVVGGATVDALGLPARTLFVALHAAATGVRRPQPLADLARAVAAVDVAIWREAAVLADQVDAAPALAAGLRLDAAGRRLADELALPSDAPLEVALRAQGAPPEAVDLARWAATDGVGPKVRLAARKLVPTPALLRLWSPLARRGRAGLAAAYVVRPVVMAWRIPRALGAIRRARAS